MKCWACPNGISRQKLRRNGCVIFLRSTIWSDSRKPWHAYFPRELGLGRARGARLIGTERVGPQCVASVGEGAGTRSTTDVAVFTGPALSVKAVWRMQRTKYFGIA